MKLSESTDTAVGEFNKVAVEPKTPVTPATVTPKVRPMMKIFFEKRNSRIA